VDEEFETNPRMSSALINWSDSETTRSMELCEFLSEVRLFMTVDTSYTATRDSDFKVACVMGIDSFNNLYVLDLWSGQCQESRLISEVFRIADRWRVPTIHPEAIKQGLGLCNNLEAIVKTRASELAGVSHLPGIKKLHPGQVEKVSKIAGLDLRFEHGKIKMPLFLRHKPQWARLFDQIEQFNPDAKDGGLQHDDELDAVAMSQFIIRGRISAKPSPEDTKFDPLEEIANGNYMDEAGNPIGFGLDWRNIPAQQILELTENIHERERGTDGTTRV